ENGVLAFVLAIAVYLLLKVNREESRPVWLAAGMALGVAALTKANLLLFLPLALAWAWGRKMIWVGGGLILVLTPWVARTWRLAGEPILYSNGGFSLWTANHRLTFDYFPVTSIDDAAGPEWDDLTAAEQAEFNAVQDSQGIRQTH